MKRKIASVLGAIIVSSFFNNVNAQYYDPYLVMMHNQFMNYAQQSWQNYQNQMIQNSAAMWQQQQQLQQQFAEEARRQMQYNQGVNYSDNSNTSTYNNKNSNGVTTQNNTVNSRAKEKIQEFKDRCGYKDCYSCRGMKSCQTCNGKGWIRHSYTNTTGDCPNCSNGKCSTCGGSGQVYGLK